MVRTPPGGIAIAAGIGLAERLAVQSHEIELLSIRSAEDEIRLAERRFKEVAALPTEIEAIVVPRVEDFREHPRTEMKESVASALQTLEQSLDNLLSSRINALENQLLELSASLADLSHRASQSHMNLQKLVNAVERLCDQRAPEPALPAASEPVPALERSLTCLSNSDRCFQFAGRQTIVSGLTEPVTTALEPWEDRYLRTIRYRFSSRLKSRLYAGPSASCG